MSDLLSRSLLVVDEAWLNHGERMRARSWVTTADVCLEELLFATEQLLTRIHSTAFEPVGSGAIPAEEPARAIRLGAPDGSPSRIGDAGPSAG